MKERELLNYNCNEPYVKTMLSYKLNQSEYEKLRVLTDHIEELVKDDTLDCLRSDTETYLNILYERLRLSIEENHKILKKLKLIRKYRK